MVHIPHGTPASSDTIGKNDSRDRFSDIDAFAKSQDLEATIDGLQRDSISRQDMDAYLLRLSRTFDDLDANGEGMLSAPLVAVALRHAERIAESMNAPIDTHGARIRFEAFAASCEINGEKPLSKSDFLGLFQGTKSPKRSLVEQSNDMEVLKLSAAAKLEKERRSEVEKELEKTRKELLRAKERIGDSKLAALQMDAVRKQLDSIDASEDTANERDSVALEARLQSLMKTVDEQASELHALRTFKEMSAQEVERAVGEVRSTHEKLAAQLAETNSQLAATSVELASAKVGHETAAKELEEMSRRFGESSRRANRLSDELREMRTEIDALRRHKAEAAAHMQAQMITIQKLQQRNLEAAASRSVDPALKRILVQSDVKSAAASLRNSLTSVKSTLRAFQHDVAYICSRGHAKLISERALRAVAASPPSGIDWCSESAAIANYSISTAKGAIYFLPLWWPQQKGTKSFGPGLRFRV